MSNLEKHRALMQGMKEEGILPSGPALSPEPVGDGISDDTAALQARQKIPPSPSGDYWIGFREGMLPLVGVEPFSGHLQFDRVVHTREVLPVPPSDPLRECWVLYNFDGVAVGLCTEPQSQRRFPELKMEAVPMREVLPGQEGDKVLEDLLTDAIRGLDEQRARAEAAASPPASPGDLDLEAVESIARLIHYYLPQGNGDWNSDETDQVYQARCRQAAQEIIARLGALPLPRPMVLRAKVIPNGPDHQIMIIDKRGSFYCINREGSDTTESDEIAYRINHFEGK